MAANGQKKWFVEAGKLISKLQKVMSRFEGATSVAKKTAPRKVAVAASTGETRRGRKADPNSKSQMVKTYFEKHGFDHALKEVAETLTKKHGQEFTVGLVANIKHRLGGTNHRETKPAKKEAKAKAPKNKVKVSKKEAAEKKGGPSLSEVVAKILADNPNGLKLGEITDKVKNSNYEYRGGKEIEGLRSNIWQCLNKMKKEGSHKGYEGTQPVVIHNADDKKYLINPKAARKVA